jgi:VCBS repeat-containing protein
VDSGDSHTYDVNTTGTIGLVTNNNDGTFDYDANGQFEALNVGQSATDTFSYIVTDFNGASHAATATVTITGVNDAPVAGSASGSVSEGTTTTIDVTGSFTDIDNASGFTYSADASSAGGGVITDNADGTFGYDPAGNFDTLSVGQSTTDTFTYVVTDALGATSSNTVTVTITGENDDPVGVADTGAVTENVSPVATGNVLANDTEIDQGDTLVVANVLTNGAAAVSQAALETFLGLTAGTLDTDLGAFDTDSGSAAKTTVTVNAGDTLTVTFDFATNESASDPDYNDGAFLSVDGDVFLLADTNFTLSPVGVPSGYGLHTGLMTYTHTFASSGTFTVGFGVVDRFADSIDSQLLLSSLDVNGSPLVLTSGIGQQVVSANGNYGSATIAGDGSYTYTLDARAEALAQGASVVESFNYALSDGNGGFSNSTLDITVTGTNDAPVIAADTNNSITEGGTPATGDLLANASDVDNGALLTTVAQTTAGAYGTLTLGTNGLYSYALDVGAEALAFGETFTENFGYAVTDEFGGTDTATLSIVVTGTNDTPTAAADNNTAMEGMGAVSGSVATNDGDVDHGAMLNYTLDAPLAGLTLNGDGSYSFDSDDAAYEHLAQGATTTVTANYTVMDEFSTSSGSTLSIVVTGTNDDPTASADSNTATEDLGAVTGSVATNDNDADDGASLSFALDMPVSGLTLNGDGSYSFDSNDAAYNSLSAGQTTNVTANYTVTDQFSATASSTLTITVTGANDAPTAFDIGTTVNEDSMGATLTADFTDVDTLDNHTFSNTAATFGDVTNNNDGTFTYVASGNFDYLKAGESTTDSFTYTVDDGHGGSVTQTANILITGVNDAPTAVADTGTATEDGGIVSGSVAANDPGSGS